VPWIPTQTVITRFLSRYLLLHFIGSGDDRCVTKASNVYVVSLGIEERDKDRVIMLTTKMLSYTMQDKK
jgi:hypothetical protein